tara:strand:+ start:608 stop:892 length:285 start_codon:yes stop_codon:yes gene_type:complete
MLISYYRDINCSFRGIDTLISNEMSKKNKDVIQLLAQANMQLESIYRSKGEFELALPLLSDVLKSLTQIKPRGIKAYQQFLELGFVGTPYFGDS